MTPILKAALQSGRAPAVPRPCPAAADGPPQASTRAVLQELRQRAAPADQMQDALDKWAGQWGRPSVIVGTHPGGCASTFGAMAAASVVVTPVIFGTRELAALDGWLGELPGYPFLIIPNRLARGLAKEWSLRKLTRIVEAASVPVGPPVSEHGWLKDRQLRMALTADGPAAGLRVRKGRREHGSRRRGSEAYGTAA